MKRKAELEVEKLRLEIQVKMLAQFQSVQQLDQGFVEVTVRTLCLPSFVHGKDSLDECLERFERYADVAKVENLMSAAQLSPLLTGKAVEVLTEYH